MLRGTSKVYMAVIGLVGVLLAPSVVQAATHTVIAAGTSFTPQAITVRPGESIEWVNMGGSHTVTSGASCGVPDGRFNMSLPSGSVTYTIPVGEPDGVIPYYCTPHCGLGMTGTITVEGPAVPAVSEWGMIAMLLSVLTLGTLALGQRRWANT